MGQSRGLLSGRFIGRALRGGGGKRLRRSLVCSLVIAASAVVAGWPALGDQESPPTQAAAGDTGARPVDAPAEPRLPEGKGLAAAFPGDRGIEAHESVVFVERFEEGDPQAIARRWGFARHLDQMALDDDVPTGSDGGRSIRMTATPQREGVELYRTFEDGWDTIFLRFNVKFAEDYGLNHHFVALRGFRQPTRVPMGGAGRLAENHFSVTLEPTVTSRNRFPDVRHYRPPGIWQFYAYWPEMRSWQTPEGRPDGRPNPYYGNAFLPEDPGFTVPRDRWITVEIMLKLNTEPEKRDGELALWVDGELAVDFAPGTPRGFFMRDHFRNDPEHDRAQPFEGFRWRHDMEVKINVLRLQNYVSGRVFERAARMAEANPEWGINPDRATVWFANVVMAREYIGPMQPVPTEPPS
ncbi:MAG: hypothetical protein JJU36_12880 [Phycisphaeraceae bacterium]|nr:hypothetical protein [Phycisphaeraceae bacterium]